MSPPSAEGARIPPAPKIGLLEVEARSHPCSVAPTHLRKLDSQGWRVSDHLLEVDGATVPERGRDRAADSEKICLTAACRYLVKRRIFRLL
jgi:hypothetical protein